MHTVLIDRLLVEVVDESNGSLLAQAVFDYLSHLVDETRFAAVSRGLLPDEPPRLTVAIEAIAGAPDSPSLAGIRVVLTHDDAWRPPFARDFSKSVAASRGSELVAALIDSHVLLEGDRYRVRLTLGPRAELSPQPGSNGRLPEMEIEEKPFPVQPASLSEWGIGPDVLDAADRSRPVFISGAILEHATAEAIRHGKAETGTLMIGVLAEDEKLVQAGFDTPWAVVLTEQVAVADGLATATSFTFPPESFRRARHLAQLRGRNESVMGSQHSHGWRCTECLEHCPIRNLFFSHRRRKNGPPVPDLQRLPGCGRGSGPGFRPPGRQRLRASSRGHAFRRVWSFLTRKIDRSRAIKIRSGSFIGLRPGSQDAGDYRRAQARV